MGRGSFIKLGDGGVPFSFFEITRRHGCYPVNLQHIFLTPLPKNTSGGLLLVPLVFTFSQNIFCSRLLFNDAPYLANLRLRKKATRNGENFTLFCFILELSFYAHSQPAKNLCWLTFLMNKKNQRKICNVSDKNNELSVYVYLGIYLLIAFPIYASISV